jgi:hopanoid biosynthesis associated protein HpnK
LKQLVVTADDFGAGHEVNDAVEAAHRDGILTAASLMVGAPATRDAVKRAIRMPSLRVGLHLVLADGLSTLPAAQVPDLVDKSGAFHANMAVAGAKIFFNPRVRRQVAAEIHAQFAAFRDTGLALDHCNAHKHFHLHPTVGRLIVDIGRRFGLNAVRVPLEQRHILARVEPNTPPSRWFAAPWAYRLRRRLRRACMLTPDHVFGLRWSGAMTRDRLLGLIRNLPDGLSEIYLHPATRGGFPGAASGYRYADEFAALLCPDVIGAARDGSLRLGGFVDFPRPAAGEVSAQVTSPNVRTDRYLTP